ncbi:choline dehydrogenase 7 [Mortierella sp. AD031]|nr:choline dehydrogenase 7 [Mortierella sp. AD031]
MEDLSDLDDDEDEEMNEEGHSDKHHGRSYRKTTDSSRKDVPTDDGGSLPPERHRMTGSRGMARGSMDDDHCEQNSAQPRSYNNININNRGSTSNTGTAMATVKKEKPEGAPKQTRKATASKRADRGRPRLVVPLKTNPDGSLSYPIVVGKGTNEVIIENMGRIVWNGRGYHNHRYIFPVGFRSKKQYTSLSDTSKKTYFISEILDGGEQPIFQITLEDMPEKVFRHSSSSGAWELALKGLMELGFNAKTHASGPDMYGLTNLGVIKYIQEMPNAHRCRRYMPLKWIIDEDNVEGSPVDSSQGGAFRSYDGKAGVRRKKFNNSLYASNHDVLLSTLEEQAAASSTSSQKIPTSPPSRPYTPRKYTKRKSNNDLAAVTTQPSPLSSPPGLPFAPPPPESAGNFSGGFHSIDYDMEHEQDRARHQQMHHRHQEQQQHQHHLARATTPLPSTVTTAAAAATMPRSMTGQSPYYPERFPSHTPPPQQQSAETLHVRSKDSRDHYDPYQQPLMEP